MPVVKRRTVAVQVEKKYMVYESLINSMTAEERRAPELLARSASRRRRIARGSGRREADVSELLATFTGMRAQMKNMGKMMAQSGGLGARRSRLIDEMHECWA